ncbi:MAG: hypothetical protein P8I55_06200 [Crocinitomix sp.]|nr:hypothetical protein [Crocinitomix sp.]
MKPEKPNYCEACSRAIELSFHHLVPKKVHNKSSIQKIHDGIELDHYGVWVRVCRQIKLNFSA